MRKLTLHAVTILGICLLVGLSSPARADDINTISLASVTWGNQVDVTLNGSHLGLENTAEMNLLLNGFQDVIGYCVAINQNVTVGGTYGGSFLVDPTSGGPSTLGAAWLVDHYAPGLGNPYSPNYLASTITALQVAIWEVTYDYSTSGTYSLNSGAFSVANLDSGISNLANSYLKAMVAADFTQSGLNSSGVLVAGTVEPPSVPEPGSMLLFGSAAGLLGWLRRRKGQAAA